MQSRGFLENAGGCLQVPGSGRYVKSAKRQHAVEPPSFFLAQEESRQNLHIVVI
jgi:hypothetical protein